MGVVTPAAGVDVDDGDVVDEMIVVGDVVVDDGMDIVVLELFLSRLLLLLLLLFVVAEVELFCIVDDDDELKNFIVKFIGTLLPLEPW